MKKEIKEKWFTALKSGSYKQGFGQLRHKDKFCCLGVLCDVVDQKGWTNKFGVSSHRGASHVLSPEFLNQCELPHAKMEVLIRLNDNSRASFNEIADYIKETL